jgi:hypothetical protein
MGNEVLFTTAMSLFDCNYFLINVLYMSQTQTHVFYQEVASVGWKAENMSRMTAQALLSSIGQTIV